MKRLVLGAEGRFHKMYESWLTKYRNKKETINVFQIICLSIWIFVCIIFFLIYVNKASTEWYFLREANQTFEQISFNYDVIKTKVLELQKQNWDKLNSSEKYGPSITLLDANVETIMISEETKEQDQE